MDIRIDTSRITTVGEMAAAALSGAQVTPKADPQPVLGGSPLTVSSAGGSADLDKLAALLLEQTNRARENSLLTHLAGITTLVSAVNANAAEANRETFEALDSLAGELKQAEKDLEKAETDLEKAEGNLEQAESALEQAEAAEAKARAARDAAQQAVNDAADADAKEKAEAELERAEAALTRAQSATDGARASVRAARGAVGAAQTALEERGAALDALEERAAGLVANLDTEGTQALTEAMRLLADELANATPLEEQERDPNEAVARDERSPAAIIRDALRRQAGDLVDSLETRRETLV